jgi:zinc protease
MSRAALLFAGFAATWAVASAAQAQPPTRAASSSGSSAPAASNTGSVPGRAELAPPLLGPAPTFTPTLPEVIGLASGAQAWVLAQPGLPLVHVVARLPAGSLRDPTGKEGLALLTARAVEEGGTLEMTPAQVLEGFDALGVELQVEVTDASSLYTFTALGPKLEPALRLLVELLARPRFDAAVVASLRLRQLSELTTLLASPEALADRELLRALYGDTPAAHLPVGARAALEALSVDDVRGFYASHYASAGLTFVLVGDTTARGARAVLDGAAPKAWLASAPPRLAPLPPAAGPQWRAVDRPGLAQTVLRVGRRGPLATDSSLEALRATSVVLGGSFTSRLMQNLREKHGFTYGVSTRVVAGQTTGRIEGGCAVDTAVTAEALRELLEELGGMATLSTAELTRAKAQLHSTLVARFGSGLDLAATLASLVARGLPPDAIQREQAAQVELTLAQVVEATKSFDPRFFSVVLVGDRARIEKPWAKAFGAMPLLWVEP